MRGICLSIVVTFSLHAAVIRGTVAEQNTGNALARTLITLQPLEPNAAAPLSTRTDDSGNFQFTSLSAGAYIVRASRRGFLPLEYGQREWNSAGAPVALDAEGVAFLNIRLHRPGAVTGVVRDDNEIGLPGHEVVAYRNTEPPELAAHTTSDDRGVYRINGLDPGVYLVRTTGAEDKLSYIPTFSKRTLRVEDAQAVQVYLDEDSKGIDVYPAPGKLFNVAGAMQLPDGSTVLITLASDMGRRTSTSAAFDFRGLPPGDYELYAEGFAADPINRPVGAYAQFTLERSLTNFNLAPQEIRDTQFDFSPRQVTRNNSTQIMARRKDLAGTGTPQPLQLEDNRANIAPGRWELMALPPAGQYVTQFSPSGRRRTRPDGWNEVTTQYSTVVRIGLSGGASSIGGVVRSAGEPAGGAPVFLEAWDPADRKRLLPLRSARGGADGRYRFDGLAPGVYRVMSSFEYLAPDTAAMELTGAKSVRIEGHSSFQLDLDLYGLH